MEGPASRDENEPPWGTAGDPSDLAPDQDEPRSGKVLRADRLGTAVGRSRFLQEARLARRAPQGTCRIPDIQAKDIPVEDARTETEEEEPAPEAMFGDLVGCSASMRRIFTVLHEVSPTALSVLVTGETGTGKELVARAIHDHSPRRTGKLVVVDCTTIVHALAESLLFGHERGAFTGADQPADGWFQEAHGGTLFLDEIGELPLEVQPKLLRALAERRVRRVGAKAAYQDVDVRVIAATHRDLSRAIGAGQFRADLYHRIAHVSVHLPPLRERREDIPAIVRAVCARVGRPERADEITALAAEDLAHRSWNGNVRELAHVVETAAVLPPGAATLGIALDDAGRSDPPRPIMAYGQAKRAAVSAFERAYFRELHEVTQGNVSEMARRSGLQRHHVRGHLTRLGIREGGEG